MIEIIFLFSLLRKNSVTHFFIKQSIKKIRLSKAQKSLGQNILQNKKHGSSQQRQGFWSFGKVQTNITGRVKYFIYTFFQFS